MSPLGQGLAPGVVLSGQLLSAQGELVDPADALERHCSCAPALFFMAQLLSGCLPIVQQRKPWDWGWMN